MKKEQRKDEIRIVVVRVARLPKIAPLPAEPVEKWLNFAGKQRTWQPW